MNIIDLYQHFQIIPILQLHQLRVASVGQTISQKFANLDSQVITTACLLHDLGNILKIDFDSALSIKTLTETERSEYKKLKLEFQRQYGHDEHQATLQMIKEIGVNSQVFQLIEAMCFTQIIQTDFLSSPLEQQICEYADMRVDPFGIVSLDDRLDDLEQRYQHRHPTAQDQQNRLKFARLMKEVEKQIFAQIMITPAQITTTKLNGTIEHLKKFEI